MYGRARDHADRVIPAFLRAAISGAPLRVDGAQCTFDFTHIDDTIRGMVAVVDRLARGQGLPPVHLVTGRPTTLGDLAALAVALAGGRASITGAPRSFDVARFHGSPERVRKLLGWTPRVVLRDGLERLLRDLRTEADDLEHQEAPP